MKLNIVIWPALLAVFALSGALFLFSGAAASNRDDILIGGLQVVLAFAGWSVIRRYGVRIDDVTDRTATVKTYAGNYKLRVTDIEAIFPTSSLHKQLIAIRSSSGNVHYVLRGAPGLADLAEAVRRENSDSDVREL